LPFKSPKFGHLASIGEGELVVIPSFDDLFIRNAGGCSEYREIERGRLILGGKELVVYGM
jgi:hypothetical protein